MALPVPESTTAPIDDVVRRAQRGDVVAFEILYREHAPRVHSLCRRLSGDDAMAGELVQDVFVRVWDRLGGFRGQSSIGTWLHRLAVNVVLERLRTNKRDALRLIDGDDAFNEVTVDAKPDVKLDLDAALARLPAGARTAFVLHDIQGYSHDEVSQLTGMAPGTARAQAWRARRALMTLLDL
jgi:RNA polymerase sigma-70 factor (ECF subfamily)